ncbi:class I SAM-dependent methyltransferase [Nocardioides sp. GCM10027113]|uniref:class I SAM-dependent methyltransferase n=1 Tax=unclassified Nocardioides TaxID=2615069 RepID=UPI00361B1463
MRPGQGLTYVAADIAPTMLERSAAVARARGVADQVTTCVADAGALPFDDGSFDRVVSFTGLHCFPDPERAVAEMARVLAPDGRLTGSTLVTDAGLRYAPLLRLGRAANVLGPGCTTSGLEAWLAGAGLTEVAVEPDGAVCWFTAVRPT